MASGYTASADEVAALRAAFGPAVASVTFWDADEGGFELAVASDWDDAEIGRLGPSDEVWRHVAEVIGNRGETVKFFVSLPDDEAPVVSLSKRQLEVLREALGDAVAYRTDSGELGVAELDPDEAASVARFEALAEALGVELQ